MRLQTLVATPRDRNGLAVTVRLAGGGDGIAYRFDGQDYWAGLSPHLRFSAATGFDHNGPTGKTSPAVARLVVMPSTPARLKTLAGYHWTGAPVAIAQRVGGVATLELTGRIRSATVDGAALTLTIQDLGETLERPVLTGRFTGKGGAEGTADAEGRLKRWSFGEVHLVEALLFDKAWNLYEVGDTSRPLADIFAPRDKGREGDRQIVAWAGSFDATLAALKAATPPAGGALVAPSIALVRWWTRPVGPLTVSVRGIAASYREDVAGIAGQLLAQAGGPAIANLAAIAPTRTGVAGLHLDSDSETAAAALDRLLGGAWMGWTLDPVTGQVLLRGFERPAGPLPRIRSHSAKRTAQLPPVRARRLGYRRNHRPHAAGDIAAALGAGDVLFDNGVTLDAFRGEIVGRLDAIVSDAVLSRSEKAQAILDWSGLAAQFSALDARFVALGNPADVAAARAAATDAVQQLGAYLSSLAPTWTDTSIDTPIVPATYRERWSTALAAVAGFSAAITGRPGKDAETYSVGAKGNGANPGPAYAHGLIRSGGEGFTDFNHGHGSTGYARSYTVCHRRSATDWRVRHFDVYGNGEVAYIGGADNTASGMAQWLNDIPAGTPVVVYTSDEPARNRNAAGLTEAMYRCGASPRMFGPEAPFRVHGAYILIGVAGWGVGRGFEFYGGSADTSPDGFVETSFSIVNGVPAAATRGQAGAKGDTGVGLPGERGADGRTFYPYYAYANSPDGQIDFTTGIPGSRAYVGFGTGTSPTEPESPFLYAWSAYRGPPFGLTTRGTAVMAGNEVIKHGGDHAWDSDAYSTSGFPNGAEASFRFSGGHAMAGLNTDPGADAHYSSIDYAWYVHPSGLVQIYENGAFITQPFIGWDGSMVFRVHYDGRFVRYFVDQHGPYRVVDVGPGKTFYFDSSLHDVGARITIVSFTAAGTRGADGADGAPGQSPVTFELTPTEHTVNADYNGSPHPEEVPKVSILRAIQGAVQVSVAVKAGTLVATGCSASLAAVGTGALRVEIGPAANGRLASSGSVRFVAMAGSPVREAPYEIVFTKRSAAPPVQASVQILASGGISGSAFFQFGNSETVAASSSGKLRFQYDSLYWIANRSSSYQSAQLEFKVQYRSPGGTWTDVPGTAATGSFAERQGQAGGGVGEFPAEIDEGNQPGYAALDGVDLDGLAGAANYEVRIMVRSAAGGHDGVTASLTATITRVM